MVALGAAVLTTQSLTEAHWVILAGGGLWFLVVGLVFVWRPFRRLRRADAGTRSTAAGAEPSWWLQPMSRRQAAVLSLPPIAAAVAESASDSGFVAFAWGLVAGGVLAVSFLALAYRRSGRSVGPRRLRPTEDDSRRKWRSYRWPRGARSLR